MAGRRVRRVGLTTCSPAAPVTEFLLDALTGPVAPLPAAPHADNEEDHQLALYLCYELHYRGLPGVDDRWEWEPSLLALRAELEARFEADLRRDVPVPSGGGAMDLALREIEAADEAPSLSKHLERHGTLEQFHRVRRSTARPTSSRRPTRTRGRCRG